MSDLNETAASPSPPSTMIKVKKKNKGKGHVLPEVEESSCKSVCLFCLADLPPEVEDMKVLKTGVPLPHGPDLELWLDDRERNQKSFDILCSLLCFKWLNKGRLKFDKGDILPLCIQCQHLYQELYHLQTQIRELGRLMKERVVLITGIIKESESKICEKGLGPTRFAEYGLDYLREKVVKPRDKEDDYESHLIIDLTVPPYSGNPNAQAMEFGPVWASTLLGTLSAEENANDEFSNSQILAPPEVETLVKTELEEPLYQPYVDDGPFELEYDSILSSSQTLFQNEECEDDGGRSGGDDNMMDSGGENNGEIQESNPNDQDPHNIPVSNKGSTSESIPDHPPSPSAHQNVNEDSAGDNDSSDDSMEDDHDEDYSDSGVRTRSKQRREKKMSQPTTKRQRLEDTPPSPPPSKIKLKKWKRVKKREQACFKCHICDETVPGRKAFIQHYAEQHPEEKRYTCKFCQEHFKGLWQVRSHQQRHTGDKPHECSYCSKRFTTKKARNNHHKWIHEGAEKRFECKTCKKTFPTRTFLKTHSAVHNKTVVFCKACGRTYKSRMSFNKHNKENHEGKATCSEPILNPTEKDIAALGLGAADLSKKAACHICWKNIHGRINIKIHFDEFHNGHNPLECVKCGKQFTCYKDVRRHVLRHEGHKPLQCDKCPKKFLTATELKNHSLTHLSDSEKPKFVCEICGNAYSAKSNLSLHYKLHQEGNNRARWVCEVCGRSYSDRKGLIHHKKSKHSNETNHHCSYCPKSFVGAAELTKHLRTHTKQKPFKCSHCDKYFPYSNSRARHVREVHNNDKKRKKSGSPSSQLNSAWTPVENLESTEDATMPPTVEMDSEETEEYFIASVYNESGDDSAPSGAGYSECIIVESVHLL